MSPKEEVVRYLPAREVKARYGHISDMALHRWLNDERMKLPRPVYFGRYRFCDIAALETWEAEQRHRGPAVPQAGVAAKRPRRLEPC